MPTYGRVPKSGCAPLGYSLDHIGPLARSVRDCATMLAIIAGHDPSDESCSERPVDDYVGALGKDISGLRIGIERTHHFPDDADPALVGAFDAAVATLASLGAEIVEVTLPYYEEMEAALWVMMAAEALAYHRNDMQTRWEDYCATTRTSLGRAAFFSAADYVQAARALGIEVFDPAAYGPAAVLFESSVPVPPDGLVLTLERAQQRLGIVPGAAASLPG